MVFGIGFYPFDNSRHVEFGWRIMSPRFTEEVGAGHVDREGAGPEQPKKTISSMKAKIFTLNSEKVNCKLYFLLPVLTHSRLVVSSIL